MKIESDKFSEKYRKYVIEIKINNNQLYAIWGTNILNPDFDYLVTNNSANIICAFSIDDLKAYFINNTLKIIDEENFKKWILTHRKNCPYTTYDLDSIRNTLNKSEFSLKQTSNSRLDEIRRFIILFSDYINQIKNKNFAKILKSAEVDIFLFGNESNLFSKNTYKINSIRLKLQVLKMIDFLNKRLFVINIT